jgi:lysophospholipase L1-like esterase
VRRTPWWWAYVTALLLLALADVPLRWWTPSASRLPEQFSAGYLERYVDSLRGRSDLVVFLGDSALWGYKLPAEETAAVAIARRLKRVRIANLSYEGGSPVNDELMLRFLLAKGIRPKLVVFNVNSKELSAGDSAYRRLRPALQLAAEPEITPGMRAVLDFPDQSAPSARLSRFVERFWLFYRYRIDVRESIFGTDDFASWLKTLAGDVTGYNARYQRAHRPAPDDFEGTYDLSPIDPAANVSFQRLLAFADLLRRERIPSLGFLTPTNHTLLHDYIDSPEYRANLRSLQSALTARSVDVVDFDARFPATEFIDNDHLTAAGNRELAGLLLPEIRRAAR